MSFRGRGGGFRGGYYPRGGGRGTWNCPPPEKNEMENSPSEGSELIEGDEEREWGPPPRGGGAFRHRGRGRGNFHSFQKNGDSSYPLSPVDILSWLDCQPPFAVQRVMFHCQWLLHQYGFQGHFEEEEAADGNGEDPDNETEEEGPSGSWYSDVPHPSEPPPHRGRGKRPGFGFNAAAQQHWTPAGWVPKDNSHKITTKMKPLPAQEIIPPFSNTYPDASNDKEKLKMLINNHGMMSNELSKICASFKMSCPPPKAEEDLSVYPEEQQGKLRTAVHCVNNALKTLNEYKDFLRNDKYKAWNAEQKAAYDERVKSMIGETPSGIPYKKPKGDDCAEDEKCADEKAV